MIILLAAAAAFSQMAQVDSPAMATVDFMVS
jgi:hypothetical protein